MEIKPKFDVHNLVKRKFDSNQKNSISILEIMEIVCNTCYAGTQVFYLCRQLIAVKEFENEFLKEGNFKWTTAHGVNRMEDNMLGWMKYREDELIGAPQEVIDIFLNSASEVK